MMLYLIFFQRSWILYLIGDFRGLKGLFVRIVVHLHSILQRKTPQGLQRRLEVEFSEGSTVLELIKHLEIDIDPDDLLLAVNGRMAKLDQILLNDDDVHLMLPISGGGYYTKSQIYMLEIC
jgi:sulfur carrier protein ThiS